jgi:F420-non-reducing hydrogenase large subunit
VSQRITIDPITRLEGHGKIEIFLDAAGDVENAYFQVPELRGFEQFVRGRPVEDMPVITNRICGVCPEAHHMAATKALDQIFMVEAPPAAHKLREMFYMAFVVTDHVTHFYVLGGPDFIVGPDAPPAERNILGVIARVGMGIGQQVIDCRKRNHEMIKRLGGRAIHPAAGLPGGWSKPLSPDDRAFVEQVALADVEFAELSLKIFDQIVLQNPEFRDLVFADTYRHVTHSMGTVDAKNRLNLYDGHLRVVDTVGQELHRFPVEQYRDHVAERVEPWTYLKFPYLKQVGWKGLVDGQDSGVYVASPLSRLNVSEALATPRADEHLQRFRAAFGGGPVHHRLATHWARLIEVLYASERMLELVRDPETSSPDVRTIPTGQINPAGGVGSVEAPRGTLIHQYKADEQGLVTEANLVVGTTNNHAAIAMSVKKAAQALIRAGQPIAEGLLNRVEMAFRLYDPCLSCATHALPGQMPLEVVLKGPDGAVVDVLRRG